MSRGAKLRSPKKPTGSAEQLRPRLEAARLELRALYRSLDRMLLVLQTNFDGGLFGDNWNVDEVVLQATI